MEAKRYDTIDGLRTFAAIGVVIVHMWSNNTYVVSGVAYDVVIAFLENFLLQVFMMISAFGLCCGYYEKVLNSQLSIPHFYKSRFQKVLPCFSILVFLDLAASPSKEALYEGFADLTLLFGLLPYGGNISVIGVGWFLGLIFVFYLCFPFFCCLLESKKKAWICFGISLVYSHLSFNYFYSGASNILYCGCFFMAGGLIYLYRDKIGHINKWLVLAAVGPEAIILYMFGKNALAQLAFAATLLIYAICTDSRVLSNRFTRFISGVSLEVYLSHMAVFRVIEKLGLNTAMGNGWVQYIVTVILVTAGSVVFAIAVQKLVAVSKDIFAKKERLGI